MRDIDKSKEQLIGELALLRQKIMEYENPDTECRLKSTNEQHHTNPSKMLRNFKSYTEIENDLKQFQAILEEIVEFRIGEISKVNQDLQEQIASRQQVEEELKMERSRLFSVLDGLPALVYLIAPDYSFQFANRLFREHFGDTDGKPCYEVFRGQTVPCEGCSTFKPNQKIETHIGEWFYPNGHTYEFFDYPFTDVDGSELLLCIGLDVSERKLAEDALRLSEERFSIAFNASPICMSITSLEDGRFIDINESFCHTIGYKQDEIIGQSSIDIGFWMNIDQREQIKQRIANEESIHEIEVQFCRSNGEQRIGLLSAEIININSELQPCLLCILSDITERRQMEIQMLRLDRLNLVGEMAASIGHEIRNPMTTVRGFLQLLSEKGEYKNDEAFFELMIEELDQANAILTEFLSLARNKMLELKPVNFKPLVNSILPLIQAKARIQDKEIIWETMNEIPDLVLDEKEIRQLIHNLVHNALDATVPGGKVRLRLFQEDEYVVLSIQDQGTGIDSKTMEKIGTPFFSTKDEGTGLGLAVCYGIAARHHATIDIETSSEGSTFMVIFPISNH